jgi:hypothetical protein
MLFSNVNGIALSDERFWPIYEVANQHGAVLYIHPEPRRAVLRSPAASQSPRASTYGGNAAKLLGSGG